MNLWISFVDSFGQILYATVLAVFIENTIFTRALGTGTCMQIAVKKTGLLPFGFVLTGISLLCSLLAFWTLPLYRALPFKNYLLPLFYVLIICVVYSFALWINVRFGKENGKHIRPVIHMSAFNCTVLGALFLLSSQPNDWPWFVGFGLGTGLGFMLATFLLNIAFSRLHSDAIPKSFAGKPVLFLYLGIISLAFYGFIGHELIF